MTLNDILGNSIFVPGCNNEHAKGELNMVYFTILYIIICKYWIITFSPKWDIDIITNVIWCWRFWSQTNKFVWYCLNVSYLFEHVSILLKICYQHILPLCDVIMWIPLYLRVRCWLEMFYMTYYTVFRFFLSVILIHKLVLFFQEMRGYMDYYLFTVIHKSCCDVHSIV